MYQKVSHPHSPFTFPSTQDNLKKYIQHSKKKKKKKYLIYFVQPVLQESHFLSDNTTHT